ncbi:MAG: hypothetical protein ACJ779_13105 [Chloroflexota bacterium]
MQAIARAARPSPTRTFREAMRVRSVRIATSALLVAWHLGTVRTSPISLGVRARSFALVVAVAMVFGTGTLAAAAAVSMVVATQPEQPRAIDRTPVALPVAPSVGPATHPSAPAPGHSEAVPAVVKATDAVAGERVIAPAAHPAHPAAKPAKRHDGTTDGDDDKGSDDVDTSEGGAQPDGDHDDGGTVDGGGASETAEPSDHRGSDDGVDGGTDAGEHGDDGSDSGG